MIFTTVGSQMPFDRLITAVDTWAAGARRGDVLAQIGTSTLKPRNIKYMASLLPVQFVEQVVKCELVITHAGMGSILTALEYGKPLVLLARRGGNEKRPPNCYSEMVGVTRWNFRGVIGR